MINSEIFEVPVKAGETLLDVALRAKLPLHHSCGGMGTCGTCRLIIREGLASLPPPDCVEAELIQDRDFAPEERLACQNYPGDSLLVEIPTDTD
jgi:2Fe-2S ferredoxin